MNARDSRWLLIRLGSLAAVLAAAACSGGAASLPGSVAPALRPATTVGAARSSQKLYISNIDGSVLVYSTAKEQELQTITDAVPRPGGLWVDGKGTLYAVNLPDQYYQTSLPEYKSGASQPFRTITDGIVNCSNVAVDGKGNVYVTGVNTENGDFFLEIYPKNKLSPSETLTVPHRSLGGIAGLAFDTTGALLVGEITEEGSSGAVYRLPAGSQNFQQLKVKDDPGGLIADDAAGNLYLAGNNYVYVYPLNAKQASRKIYIRGFIEAITVAPNGQLYVGTQDGISVYAPGSKKPAQTFAVQALIGGLALSP